MKLKPLLFPAKLVESKAQISAQQKHLCCAAFYCIPKIVTFYTTSLPSVPFPPPLLSDTANIFVFGFPMSLPCSSPSPTGPAGLYFPLLTPDSYSAHKALVAGHLVRAGPASSALQSHVIQCRHGLVAFWTQRTEIRLKNALNSAVPSPGKAVTSRGCRKLELLFIPFPCRAGEKTYTFSRPIQVVWDHLIKAAFKGSQSQVPALPVLLPTPLSPSSAHGCGCPPALSSLPSLPALSVGFSQLRKRLCFMVVALLSPV